MTLGHILRVSTHVTAERDDGVRWCFYCRKRVSFVLRVRTPNDPRSYYGSYSEIECENGHDNGDVFPGNVREWVDA